MPRFRRDLDTEPRWEPLEQLARLCQSHPLLPDLDADDFMYMGRLVCPGRPPILQYKHIFTRRYLNLDHAGHLWMITVTGIDLPGYSIVARCRPVRDLDQALASVLLDFHPPPPAEDEGGPPPAGHHHGPTFPSGLDRRHHDALRMFGEMSEIGDVDRGDHRTAGDVRRRHRERVDRHRRVGTRRTEQLTGSDGGS